MWKQRRGFRLSNRQIEITVLLGGGHVADLRLCGSPINALWEAPWPTIEPYQFSEADHAALYGEHAVGQMLSGYTGHALALGYFGMPSPEQAQQGLSLHGEAASSPWHVADAMATDSSASLTLEVELPISAMYFRRTLRLSADASAVSVEESVSNRSAQARDMQWVQHVAFGEPLFSAGEASLSLSAQQGITWPLGYEGREWLPANLMFEWPTVASQDGEIDLASPFVKEGSGFVAAVRAKPHDHAFIAVHNRRLALAAGYLFDARRFPWIALWEENRARKYPPWNAITRVRGVEFGTSPMPLGLEHAQEMRALFDTPVLATIAGRAELTTTYQVFVTPVPHDWQGVPQVSRIGDELVLHSDTYGQLAIRSSAHSDR